MYTTLISAEQLAALPPAQTVILDCRFKLTDPGWGQQVYDAGHLPGAHYLNLDYHLSGTKTGQNGRHPLPDGQRLAVVLGAFGITPSTQVVAYDDAGGLYASRAWWLLKWLGHDAIAVLDGGVAAWQANGGQLTADAPASHPTRFAPRSAICDSVDVDAVLANLSQNDFLIVDARSQERFRGEGETMDPVGGHIPGAANRFFQDNLSGDGRFKPAEQLRQEWLALLGGREPADVVHQCGSGVSACVNLLAMAHAGLAGSRLYPGSWSEWCSDPARPVAR
ncbi:sulfurtransferase [Crenobacter sp. SG2305]|uniref:sulfurtransferase n=1 Tax=Crenobacter oryzisoli TaxID=3056844 RepID=UPI0025AAB2F6|nr:sulfurtransferase [Crenobacter sp. SG2305]MDN0083049.1 sulfurtransferase [Crenobacter sp. SG2305]